MFPVNQRAGLSKLVRFWKNIVYIIPADVPKEEEKRNEFFNELSNILDIPESELSNLVEKNKFSFNPIEMTSGVEHEVVVSVEETFKDIPAVFTSQKSTRLYIDDETYSHILGYVAPLKKENIDEYLKKGYSPSC